MKRCFFSLVVLGTLFLGVDVKASYLLPDADAVVVVRHNARVTPQVNALWQMAFDAVGLGNELPASHWKDAAKKEPESFALMKAILGLDVVNNTIAARAVYISVLLPPNQQSKDFTVAFSVENATVNIAEVDAAMKVLVAREQKRDSTTTMVKKGVWTVCTSSKDAIIAYRTTPKGLMYVFASNEQSLTSLDNVLAGKTKLPRRSPLNEVYDRDLVEEAYAARVVVKDVGNLMTRSGKAYLPPSAAAFAQAKELKYTVTVDDEDGELDLQLKMRMLTHEVATQQAATLNGLRMMTATGFANKPEAAATLAALNKIDIEADDDEPDVEVSLDLMPSEVANFVKSVFYVKPTTAIPTK